MSKRENNHLYAYLDWQVVATSRWLLNPEHKYDYDGHGPYLGHLCQQKKNVNKLTNLRHVVIGRKCKLEQIYNRG